MDSIKVFIESVKNDILQDEDGNDLLLEINESLSEELLSEFSRNRQIIVPSQLQQLYQITNGCNFFGIEIPPIDMLQIEFDKKWLCINDWGNGDYDYITQDNSIMFCNHSINDSQVVSNSLLDWLISIYEEIKRSGTLLHPMDYDNNEQIGLYRKIVSDESN